MKTVDELAEEVKSRELTHDEVTYVIQKVKELTITHDKDLSQWTYLLGFAKEYQGFEAVIPEEWDKMVEKTIEDFQLLATYCPDLESIRLEMPDDEVLASLDFFPGLLRFYIDDCCCITDQGLEHVWRLSQLTHLCLKTYRGVDDAFIENLCQLTSLIELNLNGCDYVFNHNLAKIAELKLLRSLGLGASLCTDNGIPHIITMKNLACLNLGGTRISDDGVFVLSKLLKLKKISISGCKITDESLKHLSLFQELEQINLSGCEDITDQGLLYLNNIKN